MTCQDVVADLSARGMDKTPLSPDFSAHLDQCVSCRGEAEAISNVLTLWSGSQEMPSDSFFAGQRATILKHIETAESPYRAGLWRWASGMAAVALFAVWLAQTQGTQRSARLEYVQHLDMIEHLDLLETWADMETPTHG